MTEAVRRKFDLLDQQYTRTLQQRQQQTLPYAAAGSSSAASLTAHSTGTWGVHAAAEAGPIVEPQLLTVTVQGQVLSKAHIQAGSYIPAAEKEDALKLLAGELTAVLTGCTLQDYRCCADLPECLPKWSSYCWVAPLL
jgi:hypothetical protein